MSHPPSPSFESLLIHGPSLRALARALVGDDHRAEDLVQETWLHALRRPPAAGRPVRRWLTVVLRNLAFQQRRADASRAGREALAAREEARESAGDTYERFASHRALVEALDAIGDPYREAILLRYFDDLPPRAIAERLGVPTNRSSG